MHPEKNEEQLKSIQKPEVRQNWEEIELTTRKKIPVESFKWIENPLDSEMFLYLMRFQPDDSDVGRDMKKQSLDLLFKEIKKHLDLL